MKNIIISAYLMVVWSFCFTGNAYAYLDPGTGSIILQGIVGTVAAGSAAVGLYWDHVKVYFRSTFGGGEQDVASKHESSVE